MRTDINDYLNELGWSFDHTTEDGRRIWSRQVMLPCMRAVVTRYDEEDHLIEMAMEVMAA